LKTTRITTFYFYIKASKTHQTTPNMWKNDIQIDQSDAQIRLNNDDDNARSKEDEKEHN